MPSAQLVANSTGLAIDREKFTIRLTREFDAPRSEVFDAWTQPEQVTCWWDAAKEPLTICEIDLRPQGAFKFVTKSHPDMPFCGIYREIVRPTRLIFDALGAVGRVLLQESSGRTRMTVEIACQSAEHLEQFVKAGVDKGTAQTLDNLVVYLNSQTALC